MSGRVDWYEFSESLLWYILVQSIAVIWAHGSFQHCRVVKLGCAGVVVQVDLSLTLDARMAARAEGFRIPTAEDAVSEQMFAITHKVVEQTLNQNANYQPIVTEQVDDWLG